MDDGTKEIVNDWIEYIKRSVEERGIDAVFDETVKAFEHVGYSLSRSITGAESIMRIAGFNPPD